MTLHTTLGTLSIEPAKPGEVDIVMDILSDAARWLSTRSIKQWPYPLPPGEWDVMARHIAKGDVFLARLEDGRAVGTLRFKWQDKILWGEDNGSAGYVHDFGIHESVRGHGIGAAMLEWAKGYLRSRGIQFLRLDCVAHNAALNQYYRNVGLEYRGQAYEPNYVASLFEVKL